MHNIIVVHVFPMNFFYVFIVPGPILRHLGEFGKMTKGKGFLLIYQKIGFGKGHQDVGQKL